MTTYAIEADNNITAFTAAEQIPEGHSRFATEKEFAKLSAEWPIARFAEVWNGKSIAECLTFQKNVQVLSQQLEELKRLQVFLENALTTPEKEARGHEIAAKQAKLKGDNESMGKLYNGFSVERPYQLSFTPQ